MSSLFKQSKIAVFSDLHLGIHGDSAQWHEIAINWAKWVSSELDSRGIHDIMFCGDWHHNRTEISVNTLQVSAEILSIFSKFNLIIIAGNHDVYFKNRTDVNSLSIFKGRTNISIFETVHSFTHNNKVITLAPWNTSIESIPQSDYVFGHLEIDSFPMVPGKLCEDGFKISNVLDKTKFAMSGHFHIRNEKFFDRGKIVYVGNPFQMDFGDSGNDKGIYILNLDNFWFDFIENPVSPKCNRINLSDFTTKGDIDSQDEAKIHNQIVRLRIDKNITQEDLTYLTQYIYNLKPLAFSIDYDYSFNRLLTEDNQKTQIFGVDIPHAIEEFINLLEIDNKTEIIEYTIGLYNKCKQ